MGSILFDSQQSFKEEDDNKQRKGDGNYRIALREIGNRVAAVNQAEGEPKITKTFRELSLAANVQVAEGNNKNKEIENKEEGAILKQRKPAKEVTYKQETENESTDKTKKLRVFTESRSNKKHRSSRRKSLSLTSVLTARSKAISFKAACGISSEPKETIVDIDSGDADNELAVVEYVEDIYEYYKLSEDENRISDYMHLQLSINEKMRMILVDWLVEVHNKFELMPETLYLAIDLVDRFLSRAVMPRRELQLLGIGSMLLACKYEEIWAPEVKDFVCISDMAYTSEQVLAMEKAILEKLEWNLTVATPYVFLVRFIKATVQMDGTMENMAFFLAETGLMYYPLMVSFCPSLIAAAAVYAALLTMKKIPAWTETLGHYTGYTEDQLRECAKMMTEFHAVGAGSKLNAVYRKFSNPKRGAVALFPPAECLHHQA
ncbi:G2/mitotic-specific cyclin S13-6-like protein [Drosera capensis]